MHIPRLIAQSAGIQTLVRSVFPSECLVCREQVAGDEGLCGPCWRNVHFTSGMVCDGCGLPLSGESETGDLCDECLRVARPWQQGRAALLYEGAGRAMVLALKHSDRHDIAGPAGQWMARAVQDIVRDDTLVAPVPLHWTRQLKRRYNQSDLLAQSLAQALQRPYRADLLKRVKATPCLDGKTLAERFDTLRGAISIAPKRAPQIAGRHVLLVDDVMTSGATLAACTEACLASRAREVCVVTLARVAKDT